MTDPDPTERPSVAVRPLGAHLGVVAVRAIRAGELILCSEGALVRRPSRYSLQIGTRTHIDLPAGVEPQTAPERYLWRYLNHSCAPTARFEGPDLYAARELAPGDEVTFDYDTTEADIAEPFLCGCGACDGRWIRGFEHLSLEERLRRADVLAPHLRRRLEAQLAGS